ncbi:ribosomal-protein-alanine N-acetyltransferase [Metabacillus crassostreae]|uniref:ribosomal protein S18-alanine N-acetyltransferase n=1 Tax=Metabacillus crassostreae TaxID=929098 RepID=UPI00195CDEC2|nr:ribosomal protein S18-alanine N-acetyltransferase [Metabacillus crassostreae]MBM7606655.1 ribosomal-protein-alanine N-acetyltransferase [Metabacillus crassostreae]
MDHKLSIRKMIKEDIEQVYQIELLSFSAPWSKESLLYELEQNLFAKYIVVESEGQIIGYCGLWVIMEDAQITNIAVHPDYRGLNIGEALLKFAVQLSKEMKAKRITLEVRVSNHVAQSLYKKVGFVTGGIRKRYYTDNQEDALIMWVNLE